MNQNLRVTGSVPHKLSFKMFKINLLLWYKAAVIYNQRYFGFWKGFIFSKENYRERILNLLKVIASRKNFGSIYVARRDVFLHNNFIIQRFSAA